MRVVRHEETVVLIDMPKPSSFANTDLDYQLHQRNITKVVTVGMTGNQCLELTSPTAVELGYDLTITCVISGPVVSPSPTVVSMSLTFGSSSTNATAGFTTEQKDISQSVLGPVYFQNIMTVEEWAAILKERV